MVSGNLIESSSYRIFSCCNCSKPQRMHQRPSGLAPFCPRCSARLNSNKSPGQFFSVSTRRLSRKIGKIFKKKHMLQKLLGKQCFSLCRCLCSNRITYRARFQQVPVYSGEGMSDLFGAASGKLGEEFGLLNYVNV